MDITSWEEKVSQAITDNDSAALRALYDHAVENLGKSVADKKWQALISAYDGSAQTG